MYEIHYYFVIWSMEGNKCYYDWIELQWIELKVWMDDYVMTIKIEGLSVVDMEWSWDIGLSLVDQVDEPYSSLGYSLLDM